MYIVDTNDTVLATLRRRGITLLNALLFVFGSGQSPVFACKYCVRDVAFVDLGQSQYRLQISLADNSPAVYASVVRSEAERVLAGSNVLVDFEASIPDGDAEYSSSIVAHNPGADSKAVLTAPDGRSIVLDLPFPIKDDAQALRSTFEAVVRSPLRDEIMHLLRTAHSVVLIIESNDTDQNSLAKEMVDYAVERISVTLSDLPKPIETPPKVIVVTRKVARTESLLLWSLGVDARVDDRTQIALLFGRGRILGSVLEVAEGIEADVLHALAVVGLDCECGLDRRWMQSSMIPHVWTEKDEALAAAELGFDPGHPLVKAEISRILSRDQNVRDRPQGLETDSLLPGLQIIDLEFEGMTTDLDAEPERNAIKLGDKTRSSSREVGVNEVAHDDSNVARNQIHDNSSVADSSTDLAQPKDEGNHPTARILSGIFVGLMVVSILGGSVLVFLAGRTGR